MSFFVFYCYLFILSYSGSVTSVLEESVNLSAIVNNACNCMVSVRRGFLFLLVLGIGYIILLWHPGEMMVR